MNDLEYRARQNAEITRVTEGRRADVAREDRRIYRELQRSWRETARCEKQIFDLATRMDALRHVVNCSTWTHAAELTGCTASQLQNLLAAMRAVDTAGGVRQ